MGAPLLALGLGNSLLWSLYLLLTRHVVSGAALDAWAYTLVQLLFAGLIMLWLGRRAAGLQPGAPLVANLDGFPWRAQLPALAPRIISQIDGRKSVAEIYTALGAQGGLPRWEDFYAQFEDLYVKLNGVNHLLLRFRT